MARIRSAKAEFWSDAKMGGLPRDARFTFKGLIEAVADDWGCFLADARAIKGTVWPFDDDITSKKVETYLKRLADVGVIGLYEAGGMRYGYITKWFAHQRIDHPRAPQHPEPPENFARIAREAYASLSEKDRERLGKLSRLSGSGMWSGSGMLGSGMGKGAGSGSEAFREIRESADDPPPAAPSVDPARNTAETALPDTAVELLARIPAEKRRDTEQQLRAALTPKGAKLRKGEYARAQNARHLEHACRHVLRKMPDDRGVAVVWVLNKLQEPWAETDERGRTVTEAAAQNGKHERALDERDRRQRLADAEEWAAAHPDDWASIEARVSAEFPGHEHDALMRKTLGMALDAAKIQAAEAATTTHGAASEGGGR
jgi:hypothetical protein